MSQTERDEASATLLGSGRGGRRGGVGDDDEERGGSRVKGSINSSSPRSSAGGSNSNSNSSNNNSNNNNNNNNSSSGIGSVEESRTCFGCLPTRLFNVLWLSISFFVLFSAYNALQNVVTSLLPGNLGNVSLAVLYCTVAVSVFSSPFIVAKFGERKTMVFGAACYVVFMISLIEIVYGVVVFCSMVIGFGAAIMWVAEGSYLTKNSLDTERGRNSGLFWGIFQCCNIVGNLVTFFVFQEVSQSTLFIIFTILGASGVFLMLFLRAIPSDVHAANAASARAKRSQRIERTAASASNATSMRRYADEIGNGSAPSSRDNEDDGDDDDDDVDEATLADQVKSMSVRDIASEIVLVFKQPGMLMLLPMLFWTGIELSFWAGEFTQLLDSKYIGFVLMFVGIGDALGAVIIGYVSDIIGRSLSMLIGVSLYAAALVGTVTLYHSPNLGPQLCVSGYCAPWYAFVAAFCFGVADSVFNTQLSAIVGQMFSKKSVSAFCVYQFAQNVGSAVGFFYPLLVPMHGDSRSLVQVWCQVSLLFVATVFFILVDRFRLKWSLVSPSLNAKKHESKEYARLGQSDSNGLSVRSNTNLSSTSAGSIAAIPASRQSLDLAKQSTRVAPVPIPATSSATLVNEPLASSASNGPTAAPVMGGSGSAFVRPQSSRTSLSGSRSGSTLTPGMAQATASSTSAAKPTPSASGQNGNGTSAADAPEAEYDGNGDLLELIFSHPALQSAFSLHCRKAGCQENMDVCVAIDGFRKMTQLDGRGRLQEAQRIVANFILPNSPQQVNIEARMQQRLVAHIEQLSQLADARPDAVIELPANTFDAVDRLIRFYLRNDICPRFVLTGEFRRAYAQYSAEHQQISL